MTVANQPRPRADTAPRQTRKDAEEQARAHLEAGRPRETITILMRTYGDDLYRHCCAVLGDAFLADDVHQTVFVEAFRDLDRFGGRSSMRTWLYAIARHRCLDALKGQRRRRRRFALTRRGTLPETPCPRPSADADLGALEGSAALIRALATLPDKARIAVLLRYQEGLTYPEMAEICGERPATLQARVSRALERLRAEMRGGDDV